MGLKSEYGYTHPNVADYARMQKELMLDGKLNPNAFHLPSFICIGAQKAGTTWLYVNLKRHPQFRFKSKEVHYFDINRNYSKPLEYYSEHFKYRSRKVITGDITPSYGVLDEDRIELMHKMMPDAKLIMLMRNPVDRAWSMATMHFAKNRGMNMDEIPINTLIDFYKKDKVMERGNYMDIIERFTKYWSREQLFLGFYEQIKEDPEGLLQDVLNFLGARKVDLNSLAAKEVINKRTPSYEMPDEIRERLREYYRLHIDRMVEEFGEKAECWKWD